MSLPAYLANIKSSGIYRFVWDKSEIPNTTTEILRLVVGYSERGPFNTPVYIRTQTEFRSVFGGISKKLERQGCWFHRLALQALRKGPILCLNLKNFQDETIQSVSFNSQEGIGNLIDLAIKDIYDTNRFWTLEPELLEEITGTSGGEDIDLSKKYITIAATDSKESSNTIFIRGYEPKGYDVTFKEWYSSTLNGTELPSYLEGYENRKLKDFWAEIYVFRGRFTKEIATSDVLCKYFDVVGENVKLKPYITNAFGEKKDTLDLLAANDASNFIRKYQGILLPEFQSATGSTLSLDIMFNNDNQLHKMMMRLNQSLLYEGGITVDNIDTTGWDIAKNINSFAGYATTAPAKQVLSIDGNIPVVYGAKYNPILGGWGYDVVKTNTDGVDVDGMAADFYTYDMTGFGENVANVVTIDSDNYTIKIIHSNSLKAGNYNTFDCTIQPTGENAEEVSGKLRYTGMSLSGDTRYIDFTLTTSKEGWSGKVVHITETDFLGLAADSTPTPDPEPDPDPETQGETNPDENPTTENQSETPTESNSAISIYDEEYVAIGTVTITIGTLSAITTAELFSKMGIVEGDTLYIKKSTSSTSTEDIGLATITKISKDSSGNILITTDKDLTDADTSFLIKCAGSVTATSINLKPTYIQGYEYAGAKMKDIPGNDSVIDPQVAKNNWINYHIGVLDTKGLRIGLTNRTDVDYRYLVDTFEAFAVPGECHSKLTLICKMKFNVLGFINFPNMKSFNKCKTMSFADSNGFDSKYIAMGNNPMMPADGRFELASEDNGASFVSYNTPVILKDPETGVKTAVPSAALVSNDFLEKFEKYLPYTIIAGPIRGRISDPNLVGPEFSFSREDLDNLEPMGVNCMVYVPGKGTYINSNQTAKQNPVSALSKIHVRELCTFLQDEIEKMMEYYHWDFNTPNLRQTLKDKADAICDTAYRNSGIYDYLNVCDISNNTPEVIDAEMIVLSTSIEPARGAGKMVQELTLYRTGGLRAAIRDAQ